MNKAVEKNVESKGKCGYCGFFIKDLKKISQHECLREYNEESQFIDIVLCCSISLKIAELHYKNDLQIPQKSYVACIQTSAIVNKVQAGRYKVTQKKNKPLTYEMAFAPHDIAHKKGWNSWNTSNLLDGNRSSETAIEDMFIRRFMTGTWPSLLLSEVIIKRQFNTIRIAGILRLALNPRQIYFLTGYCEELLSYWLQCPVKLEIQIAKRTDVIFKYI